jgi:hypothetical protein
MDVRMSQRRGFALQPVPVERTRTRSGAGISDVIATFGLKSQFGASSRADEGNGEGASLTILETFNDRPRPDRASQVRLALAPWQHALERRKLNSEMSVGSPREGAFEMAVTKASLWQAVKNIVTLGRAAKKKR